MEFKGLKCPVCDTPFENGDDIVVCPDCGAPHHRECWEKENRCAYEDKHGEDFDYSNNEEDSEESNITVCPRCNTENPKDSFYCAKCGAPLGANAQQNANPFNNAQNNQNQNGANPFAAAFDPMGGVNPEEDLGGVTAGDLAKYVGNNTNYFMRVFSRIKTFGKSRFSFCGFLFSGFYLLYRKMYKIGAIVAAAVIILFTIETYIQCSPAWYNFEKALATQMEAARGSYDYFLSYYSAIEALGLWDKVAILVMSLCSSLGLVLRVIVGIFANRWYFRHCRDQVKKIKETDENPNKAIESKGGVNLAIALSIGAIYAALHIIPMLFFGL